MIRTRCWSSSADGPRHRSPTAFQERTPRSDLPGDIENRNIVLIDDVLYTGRTIRAALDQLIDFGRPRRVQLAVLIDRGKEHRELPIQADYIGKLVPTKKSEIIKVMLQEFDEEEGVVIVERPSETA